MNIDVEIAKLTTEYVNKLKLSSSKQEFSKIEKEYSERKQEIVSANEIDNFTNSTRSSVFWYRYGSSWLISNYLYDNPAVSLDIIPERYKSQDEYVMRAIALSHPNNLDWFSINYFDDDGIKHKSNKVTAVRNFVRNCAYEKTRTYNHYLGDNVFLILKEYIEYNSHTYFEVFAKYVYSFDSFISEVNGDISNSELYDFDLSRLDLSKYKHDNIKSDYIICKESEKMNIPHLEHALNNINLSKYTETESFGIKEFAPKSTRLSPIDNQAFQDYKQKNSPIFYISDIHLCHILARNKATTYEEIHPVIREIASQIKSSYDTLLNSCCTMSFFRKILFVGDVSSNRYVYELFLYELNNLGIKDAIFILGNHEYWDFTSISEAVEWYKKTARKYGYLCLHNDLFLYNDTNWKQSEEVYPMHELVNKSDSELRALAQNARTIILAGTGFAGCNNSFNSNNGIYRNGLSQNKSLSRQIEIKESNVFSSYYNQLVNVLFDRQVIICTHNPVSDWTIENHCPNWIYVSGHTHKNFRKVSKNIRIYSDNQIGYLARKIHLKYFATEFKNNIFDTVKDGIHKISTSSYQQFMDGRNIRMSIGQVLNDLYMIKKNGYYMFITYKHTPKHGLVVNIMDGGHKKKLPRHDINYFYDNIDYVIEKLLGPLTSFKEIMSEISVYIRHLGGTGNIHGCIVDIDFYNHLYVNPYDLKITSYYAPDVTERIVYNNIEYLLEDKCPEIYKNYVSTKDCQNTLSLLTNAIKTSKKTIFDKGTYLYKESNIIKRSDLLLSDNILTAWID